MPIREINGLSFYQNAQFDRFSCLLHGFTTRRGGVSTGAYESLSMSPRRGDDFESVRKNEKILCHALQIDHSRLTSTRQEHTDNIRIVDSAHIGFGVHRDWDEGVDGCITTEKNVALLCYSADCVPILFFAKDICAIGAVHAGWRGSAKNIAGKAVKKLMMIGAAKEEIFVAIGPCIGRCCYEVDAPVALNFNKDCYDVCENGKYMLDLAEANKMMLTDAGVPEKNITLSKICTKCQNDLFFSHRGQNGKSGTLGGIICIKE